MTQHLINYIIDQMALFLIEGEGLTLDEALHTIYESEVYENLQDTETGLLSYSPSYVYELLKIERARNHIKKVCAAEKVSQAAQTLE